MKTKKIKLFLIFMCLFLYIDTANSSTLGILISKGVKSLDSFLSTKGITKPARKKIVDSLDIFFTSLSPTGKFPAGKKQMTDFLAVEHNKKFATILKKNIDSISTDDLTKLIHTASYEAELRGFRGNFFTCTACLSDELVKLGIKHISKPLKGHSKKFAKYLPQTRKELKKGISELARKLGIGDLGRRAPIDQTDYRALYIALKKTDSILVGEKTGMPALEKKLGKAILEFNNVGGNIRYADNKLWRLLNADLKRSDIKWWTAKLREISKNTPEGESKISYLKKWFEKRAADDHALLGPLKKLKERARLGHGCFGIF